MGNQPSASDRIRQFKNRRWRQKHFTDKGNRFHLKDNQHHHQQQQQETSLTLARKESFKKLKRKPSNVYKDALNESEKDFIKSSWPHLESDLQTILTESFLALFTEHPKVKEKFFQTKSTASGINGIPSGDVLQRHIPKVKRVIVKVIRNIDDLDSIADYLQVMGKLHYQQGIQFNHLKILGPYIVSSAVCHLPSDMRDRRFQEAWLKFFAVLNELMKQGYPEVEMKLTSREKDTIKATFKLIQSIGGESTVLKLFQTYSTTNMNMPISLKYSPQEELLLNQAMENHGLLLIKVVEDVIKELEHPDQMESLLINLGHFHEKSDVSKQYFDVMGPFFCQAIRPILQSESQWTPETRDAWLKLFRIISFHMKRGYKDKSNGHVEINEGYVPHYKKNLQVHHNYHGRRRISMDEINDRKVRLQSQHCHLYLKTQQKPMKNCHLSQSTLSVVADIHNYGNRNSTLSPSQASSSSSVRNQIFAPPTIFVSHSALDLRRHSSSMLSTGGGGCSSAILQMANEAQAEAKANRRRRSSLHQLMAFTTKLKGKDKNGDKDKGDDHMGKHRPRSKSATYTATVGI